MSRARARARNLKKSKCLGLGLAKKNVSLSVSHLPFATLYFSVASSKKKAAVEANTECSKRVKRRTSFFIYLLLLSWALLSAGHSCWSTSNHNASQSYNHKVFPRSRSHSCHVFWNCVWPLFSENEHKHTLVYQMIHILTRHRKKPSGLELAGWLSALFCYKPNSLKFNNSNDNSSSNVIIWVMWRPTPFANIEIYFIFSKNLIIKIYKLSCYWFFFSFSWTCLQFSKHFELLVL